MIIDIIRDYYDLHLRFHSNNGEDVLTDSYANDFDSLNNIAIKYNGHWGDSGVAGKSARSINFDFESENAIRDAIKFLKEAIKAFPGRITMTDEAKSDLVSTNAGNQ